MSFTRWIVGMLAGLILAGPTTSVARAQEPPPAIRAAERLAGEGRYGAAAERLLMYLEDHPTDAGVRWRAAQLLLRAGDRTAAHEQYRIALHLTPFDPWLRVEYAEALMDAGLPAEAVETARPLTDVTPADGTVGPAPEAARARALTVLGTAAYWRSDPASALRYLEAALEATPGHAPAVRSLQEIRRASGPWARLGLEGFSDDQPYNRVSAALEAGTFLSPSWTAAVRVTARTLDVETRGAVRSAEARAVVAGRVPGASLDVAAELGAAFQERAEPVAKVEAALRLPGAVRVIVRGDRSRYLWTVASASTLLMVEGAELVLDRAEAPGWAGAVSLRGERFPDGNTVTTAYAWVLAPLVTGIRAGWSSAWQDAAETRWSPELGRYDAYYTPEEQLVHNVLVDARARAGSATLGLNLSYGVRATELAPESAASADGTPGTGRPPGSVPGRPGDLSLRFAQRSYSPWRALVSMDVPLGDRVQLRGEVGREETAYYALNRASLVVVVRP